MTTYAVSTRRVSRRAATEVPGCFAVLNATVNSDVGALSDDAAECGTVDVIYFTLNAAHNITATPTLPITGPAHQRVCVINEDSTYNLTLSDDNKVSGTKLLLKSYTLTLGPGHRVYFRLNNAGTFWIQESDPWGNCAVNVISAHSGGGQGSATAITEPFTVVTTVAANGDSVKISEPGSDKQHEYRIFNAGANAMDLYPVSGDSFNNLAANQAIAVAPGTGVRMIGTAANVYRAL